MGILTSYPLATLFVIAIGVFLLVLSWTNRRSGGRKTDRPEQPGAVCPKCGVALHGGAKFCQRCGERV